MDVDVTSTSFPPQRLLFLSEKPEFGHSEGEDIFRLHWEFWLQASMILQRQFDRMVRNVSDEDAVVLAEWIEEAIVTEPWQIHLFFWGDENGRAVRSFTDFLRAGGFEVVHP